MKILAGFIEPNKTNEPAKGCFRLRNKLTDKENEINLKVSTFTKDDDDDAFRIQIYISKNIAPYSGLSFVRNESLH